LRQQLACGLAALVTGTREFPLTEIPFAKILERIEAGIYQAKPAKIFPFEHIQAAHRCLEADRVVGKVV
jgi:NADPH:quinone reductase